MPGTSFSPLTRYTRRFDSLRITLANPGRVRHIQFLKSINPEEQEKGKKRKRATGPFVNLGLPQATLDSQVGGLSLVRYLRTAQTPPFCKPYPPLRTATLVAVISTREGPLLLFSGGPKTRLYYNGPLWRSVAWFSKTSSI